MKVHIYGQDYSHEDVVIAGDYAGLTALRDAIDRAINADQPASCTLFCEDGEGYDVVVVHTGEVELMVPYSNWEDGETRAGVKPFDLVRCVDGGWERK